jgi:hypothetical protein
MRIYIAAPYTQGDVAVNLHRVFEVADELVKKGHTPYIPHWTHFWHIYSPKEYGFWLEYDATFIIHWAEALLYLDGISDGAAKEAVLASSLYLPIFHSIEAVPDAFS